MLIEKLKSRSSFFFILKSGKRVVCVRYRMNLKEDENSEFMKRRRAKIIISPECVQFMTLSRSLQMASFCALLEFYFKFDGLNVLFVRTKHFFMCSTKKN